MSTNLIKTYLLVWSANAYDDKMLLDIPVPMNYVMIDQLALSLAGFCLDNMLQISSKLLLCFAKIVKILKYHQFLACKISYVQLINSMYCSVFNRFQ